MWRCRIQHSNFLVNTSGFVSTIIDSMPIPYSCIATRLVLLPCAVYNQCSSGTIITGYRIIPNQVILTINGFVSRRNNGRGSLIKHIYCLWHSRRSIITIVDGIPGTNDPLSARYCWRLGRHGYDLKRAAWISDNRISEGPNFITRNSLVRRGLNWWGNCIN